MIYSLITIISLSLAGLMIVQFFWIRNAFRVKEDLFNRRVNDAMGSVVENLETRENMVYISRNYEGDSILQIVKAFSKDTTKNLRRNLDSLLAYAELPLSGNENQGNSHPVTYDPQPLLRNQSFHSFHYQIGTRREGSDSTNVEGSVQLEFPGINIGDFSFEWNDQMAILDSLMEVQQEIIVNHELLNDYNRDVGEILRIQGISSPVVVPGLRSVPPPKIQRQVTPRSRSSQPPKQEKRENQIAKLENKARKIQEMIKQMALALETKPAPTHQRINKNSLQVNLTKALSDKGILLPFEFAVYSPTSDTNVFPIRSDGFSTAFGTSSHRISLFPNDLFQKPDLLLVHFDGQKAHVLKSLSWLMAGSLLFTLVIILASGASFVVMIRQKRISDIKTDFINNMTHEFKTPIATISIAADSITNPRVLTEPETIRSFTRIIKEENNRMNTRVEQVLQMALLDSRDFRLRPILLDINELVEKVIQHFRLQIESRGGTIVFEAGATHSNVIADEDHIRNVILNLLDNANKYSVESPAIRIFTYSKPGKVFIGVEDHGIGMSGEVQRRIFDKFYRVTTGNIHNIKGFGLGLSYVKAIVLAHHGEIQVRSEPGKGSLIEIGLPLANSDHKNPVA